MNEKNFMRLASFGFARILHIFIAGSWLVGSVSVFPPDMKPANASDTAGDLACRLEHETSRPSIIPRDLRTNSFEELASRHLIKWLPEQKTTTARSGYDFTGLEMCPRIKIGTSNIKERSRVIWFTAITAAEKSDANNLRSENYLSGVRAMVLSAVRNAPSLIPVVIYLVGIENPLLL
jgi:hypothetical protein